MARDILQRGSIADVLLTHFESRYKRNPSYSYRAFARDLGISRSQLSDVLKGRYGLSETSARKIADNLELSESEFSFFFALNERQFGRTSVKRTHAENLIKQLVHTIQTHRLSLDHFQTVSDWYHFAILELSQLKQFTFSLSWIGEQLGVESKIVEQAVSRLARLGMADISDGQFKTTDSTYVGDEVPSEAIRNFHSQVLDKAKLSIKEQSPEVRYLSSNFIALREDEIPIARQKIQTFLDDFAREFDGTGEKERVFALSLQFFDLLVPRKQN